MTSQPEEEPDFREVTLNGSALVRNIQRGIENLAGSAVRVIDLGADAFGCGAALVAPIAARAGCTHALVGRVGEALALAATHPPIVVVCSDPLAGERRQELHDAGVIIAHRTASGALAALAGGEPVAAVILDSGRGAPGLVAGDEEPVLRAAEACGAELIVIEPRDVLGATVLGIDSDEATALPLVDAEQVMTLWAPIIGLKSVGADEGVSYGYRYRTTEATVLAIVSLGYADGLDRAAGNSLHVRVGKATFPIAGRVAMDAFVLDLGRETAASVGDRVVVWGDARIGEPDIADAARRLGMRSAELATRLTARPRRRVVGGVA